MNFGDDLSGVPFEEHWRLYSGYDQENSFRGQHGQAQISFDSEYNFSLEPDEVELEQALFGSDHTFAKRHTMPDFGVSQVPSSTSIESLTQLTSNSPKRAETYPSTHEVQNIARNQRLLENLLSKIEPGTASTSPDSNSHASDTANEAQSLPVNVIADFEWPVPTFFIGQIGGPTPPALDRADDLTPDELDNSPKPFANIQSQEIENTQTNDYLSVLEDLDSVPPINLLHHKALKSDSGIGTSIMQSRKGGRSSTRGSQAKGSVMFDKGSAYCATTTGFYQQAAAMGPLTSAASSTARKIATQPALSETALKTMKTVILEPILKDIKFRDFWHICELAGTQMETGQIGTLRDLEKFLFHKASNQQNNQAYNIFCKEFLGHVRESLKYMPENELLRSYDRPYDMDYFLDTLARFNKSTPMPSFVMGVTQNDSQDLEFEKWLDYTQSQPGKRFAETRSDDDNNHAKRLKPNQPAATISAVNEQAPFVHGGYDHVSMIHDNGLEGGVIRSISKKTSVMGPPAIPASVLNSAIAIKVQRNKSRRRASGLQQKEPQFFQCIWPDCRHEPFTRACDLTKHKKTHTRPHKCDETGCKYAIEGFPTEKERDRHWTDKHSKETPNFHCQYPPCTYKSKRDSNCKQHMEKAHGYKYVRQKQNYNKTNGSKRQSASPTSPTSQGNTAALSPVKPGNSVMKASQMTQQFHTTDNQPCLGTEFPLGIKEQYTMDDVQRLENLIPQTQPSSHEQSFLNTFGNQGFLPYPLDEAWTLQMPDANIDPTLHYMNDLGIEGGT